MSMIPRRRFLSLLGAAGVAVTLSPVTALSSSRTIICNWDRSFPPYSMEQDGRMTGILVESMDAVLGERMGFSLDHRGLDWPDAQLMVETGRADALCTNPTDPRRRYLLFSEDAVVESLPSIFCSKDNPRKPAIDGVTTLAELKQFRLVDYKGNGWARRTFPPNLQITWVNDLFEAFTLIDRGEADIFVGNGLAARYAIRQLGLKQRIAARELPVGEPSSFHFGLRRDYPGAAKIVADFDGALEEAMLENVTREIIMRYL